MVTSLAVCFACQNSSSVELLERIGQYNLYICPLCGLTFSFPMRAAGHDFYQTREKSENRWEFRFIYKKMQQFTLNGSLLDIGCKDGRFMEIMKRKFSVTGLDINRYAIDTAKFKRRLNNVYPITLEEYVSRFLSKRYDVITAFHLLEHVEEPNKLLVNIKQCLKSGGMIAISVPNPKRWTLRWIREVWDYPPYHLTRWTPNSLRALLENHGFAVMEINFEKMTTLSQIRTAVRDIIWTIVLRKLSFGTTSRIYAVREKANTIKGNIFTKNAYTLLVNLWSILINLKGMAIQALSYFLALIMYPVFRFGNYEGNSILVLAKLRD